MNCKRLTEDYENDELAQIGLLAFSKLSKLWELSDSERSLMLGGVVVSNINKWIKESKSGTPNGVPQDVLIRLSLILGIRKEVEILFPKERQNSYMRTANSEFGGKAIIDLMVSGSLNDLNRAREYLAQSRSPGYL